MVYGLSKGKPKGVPPTRGPQVHASTEGSMRHEEARQQAPQPCLSQHMQRRRLAELGRQRLLEDLDLLDLASPSEVRLELEGRDVRGEAPHADLIHMPFQRLGNLQTARPLVLWSQNALVELFHGRGCPDVSGKRDLGSQATMDSAELDMAALLEVVLEFLPSHGASKAMDQDLVQAVRAGVELHPNLLAQELCPIKLRLGVPGLVRVREADLAIPCVLHGPDLAHRASL
mmetsp:Transcript_102482/g.265015  ORF Transcript_102482/g.265015 Transcript_102482/m.265015 type:complete len:230 (-) Transcript_102482:531-1220(-)